MWVLVDQKAASGCLWMTTVNTAAQHNTTRSNNCQHVVAVQRDTCTRKSKLVNENEQDNRKFLKLEPEHGIFLFYKTQKHWECFQINVFYYYCFFLNPPKLSSSSSPFPLPEKGWYFLCLYTAIYNLNLRAAYILASRTLVTSHWQK